LAAKPELLAPPEPVNEPAPAVIVPTPVVSAPESKAPLASSPAPLSSSSDPSTEELKQQAARLQEQLSSMLFTETPKPPVSTLTVPPAKETIPAPEVAQKILELASATPEVTPGKPLKTIAPPSPKSAPSSIASEEIKIPSWLAPLARETQSQNSEAANSEVAQSEVGQESEVPDSPEATFISELQESSRRPETAVFGGQLLGESSQSSDAPASGSKTGLFIGIAAALLLIAGGAWYSRQPGNAISSLFGGNSPSSQPAATSSLVPAASVAKSVAAPVAVSNSASAPSSVNLPAPVAPVNNNPSAAMAVNANPSAPSASRNTPHLEEPKKPALGDVRLATPVIGHPGAESAVGESEPSIDVNSSANSPSPVSALVSGHKAEPTAPLPIGGDVKPAQLLKSVPPVYPQMARNQHVVGNVQIDALIDADGHVSAMKVLAGPTLLHQAALDALKQWKYQPAELDGKPTAMHLTVTIQFRAQ
jgi:TonB family protein